VAVKSMQSKEPESSDKEEQTVNKEKKKKIVE
jgi:hypothetical protein